MPNIGRILLVLGLLLLGACSAFPIPASDQIPPEAVTPSQAGSLPPQTSPTGTPIGITDILDFDPDQVQNSKYQLGFLNQIKYVRLKDGRYQEGAPGSKDYVSVTMTDFIAWGDLNEDGENETVAIVAENYGGSGTFVFLAIFQNQNDELTFLASIYLDDRPLVKALSVENGEIFVDAVIHDSDDTMCCPTLSTTRHYFLNGVNLVLSDYSTLTPEGRPRTITIEAPVDGIEVSGIIQLKGNVSIAPFENSLVYRVLDLGGVELSVGPISVDAPEPGAAGTFEKAIDLGNIINNTTIRIEVEDKNVDNDSLFAMDSVLLHVR